MLRSEILQLAFDMSRETADPITLDKYLTETFLRLAMATDTLLDVQLLPVAEGAASIDLPLGASREVAIFYDDRQLFPTTLQTLEGLRRSWRDEVGTPRYYLSLESDPGTVTDDAMRELETDKVRLYPKPDRASKDFIFLFGDPMGLDFPAYAVGLVYTMDCAGDGRQIMDWLVLPIIFETLGREFAQVSDHQDMDYADTCAKIAKFLYNFLGVRFEKE